MSISAISRDITERKKAEEILKSKLEELRCSNEELEQCAYVSSHDLQEPLRMITSYLQLLRGDIRVNLMIRLINTSTSQLTELPVCKS